MKLETLSHNLEQATYTKHAWTESNTQSKTKKETMEEVHTIKEDEAKEKELPRLSMDGLELL